MKTTIFLSLLLYSVIGFAQESNDNIKDNSKKYYVGLSFGRSFPVGDFGDTDYSNPDAGFADGGNKFDVYGGYLIDNHWTVTGTFRYQNFSTDIDGIINDFNANNSSSFTGDSEDWNVYYLLIGTEYKVNITKKFGIYPRVALGSMVVNNPEINVQSTGNNLGFTRSSESGIGLGYEIGIGLKNNLGKRVALMPTFAFSGGWATITDVEDRINNTTIIRDIDANVFTFNLGLSLAYRF